MIKKLLLPLLKSMFRKIRPSGRDDFLKFFSILFVALLIFGVSFWAMTRLLLYFRSIEVIGEILTRKVLSIIYLSFFFVLIMSNSITAFSTYFFSEDLNLIKSSPISLYDLFLSRFIYTLIMSSYLVMFFFLPVLFSYGYVYKAPLTYYLVSIPAFFIFLMIPCAIGSAISFLLVTVFPARKARDFLFITALLFGIALYILIRVLRPEKLVDPERFRDLANYISSLYMPEKFYLPSYWLTKISVDALKGRINSGFLLFLLSGSIALTYLTMLLYGIIDKEAWSKVQEAKGAPITGSTIFNKLLFFFLRPAGRIFKAFLLKDTKIFFRDTAQWSQIFLLGALIVVYLYNYYVLPLDRLPFPTLYMENFVAFVNKGLAGFVVAAVATRFLYSAISLEGEAIWIIKNAPVSPREFLMSKAVIGFIPLFILAEILIIATNFLLHTTKLMMAASAIHIAIMVTGLVSLGIGIGTLYPNFKYENVAQIPMGYGGFIYMVLSLLYVGISVLISAVPIYTFFKISLNMPVPSYQVLLSVVCIISLIILHSAVIYHFFRLGEKAFENLEIS